MSAPLVVEMNGQSVGIQLLTWADDGKRKQQQQQQEIVTYRSTHTHTHSWVYHYDAVSFITLPRAD